MAGSGGTGLRQGSNEGGRCGFGQVEGGKDTLQWEERSKTLRISHYPETVTTREQFVMELDNDLHLYLKRESYRAIRDSDDLTFKLDSENSDMLLYIHHDLVL